MLTTPMLLAALVVGAEPTEFPVWPGQIPGPASKDPKNVPTLTLSAPPEGKANGTVVIVIPGGGYSGRATGHEGTEIAQWLNERGITAFILKYRTVGESKITPPLEPGPMLDVQRAIRTVRFKADRIGCDPKRVGIWGFSAGGHLASTAATHFDAGAKDSPDPIDRVSSRPDFVILAYPVISMKEGVTHGGSRKNLLGDKPDAAKVDFYSNELHVTKDTPPTFLFHTAEDTAVPLKNSQLFEEALKKAGVEGSKLYVEEKGRHGIGLGKGVGSKWPAELEAWMKERGVLGKK